MKLRLSYFTGELDRIPKVLETEWSKIADQLTAPVMSPCTVATCGTGDHALVIDEKHKGCRHKYIGAWSPAAYPPGMPRAKKNVAAVSLLVLDLDHLTDAQLAAAAEALEPYRYVAHATHGDRAGDRAIRAVVALSRPVAGADWDRFWPAAIAWLALPLTDRRGGTGGADRQTCDASRLYFLPSRPSDGGFLSAINEGANLDVDAVMATAAPERPADPVRLEHHDVAPVDAQRAAALAIAAAWPAKGRHTASLALCGALATSGWPEDAIANFVAEVTRLAGAEPELDKRRAQAASSVSKVAAGEHVSGWGSVAAALTRAGAVDDCRASLGIRDRQDDAVALAFDLAGPSAIVNGADQLSGYPSLDVLDDLVITPVVVEPPAPPGSYLAGLQRARRDVETASGTGEAARDEAPLFSPARDLFSAEWAPVSWLVEGLILTGGVAVIGSEPKTAKSWIATDIAAACSSGTLALGKFKVPKATKTAYFYAEDLGPSIRNRLRAFAAGRGVRPEDLTANLHVQPRGRHLDLTRDEDLARIVASCRQLGGVGLLVLDPLRDVHSGKENESDDMAEVFRRIRLLGDLLQCTVLVVHHAKKPSKEQAEGRPGQDMRGSSAIYGSIDSGLYLRGLTGNGETVFTNQVTSEVKGARSAGRFDLTLTIRDGADQTAEHATWTHEKQRPEAEDASVVDAVMCECLDLMRTAEIKKDPPLTTETLRKVRKGRTEIITAAMISAEREGLVSRLLVGRKQRGWGLTESGREFVIARPTAAPPAAAPIAGTILGPEA